MATSRTCDVCGRETEEIVSKLFLAPVIPGKTRATHASYTAHLDIGRCCAERVIKLGKWQHRVTRDKAGAKRRLRPAA